MFVCRDKYGQNTYTTDFKLVFIAIFQSLKYTKPNKKTHLHFQLYMKIKT